MFEVLRINSAKNLAHNQYEVNIDVIEDGVESTFDYAVSKDASFGMGPVVWEALQKWIDDGNEVDEYVEPPLNHAALKLAAEQQLEEIAENFRGRFIANTAGKQAEYELKAQVAPLVLANPDNPPQEALDVLKLEAEARGVSVVELATLINEKAKLARRAAGLIGASVVQGKTAINALADDDTLRDVLAALVDTFINTAQERFEALMTEESARVNA